MYAFCYTVASLHMSDPIFLYTEIHHPDSGIPQRSHQRNQSLAAFCNPTLYYTHEQNLQVPPPPRTDHLRKSELIGRHPNYPSEQQLAMIAFLHPICGKSYPDSPWQMYVHQGAMQKQKSNPDDQPLWQQSGNIKNNNYIPSVKYLTSYSKHLQFTSLNARFTTVATLVVENFQKIANIYSNLSCTEHFQPLHKVKLIGPL